MQPAKDLFPRHTFDLTRLPFCVSSLRFVVPELLEFRGREVGEAPHQAACELQAAQGLGSSAACSIAASLRPVAMLKAYTPRVEPAKPSSSPEPTATLPPIPLRTRRQRCRILDRRERCALGVGVDL